jgi:predicted Zn-dependent protease
MLLADLALDPAARQASARVVFDNAEELELRRRAAQVLGEEIPDMEDLPYIQPGERGLQLILVALPPCDVQIVREAAALFTEVTGVPAKLVQLHADWNFGSPDRVPRQKTIQRFLASLPGGPADFSGWKMEDYEAALRQRLGDAAPLDRFHITQFLEDFPTWSGQYHVVPPLNVLAALVAEYRTSDFRTVYVGVTAANIYDEDVNYLFSAYAGSLGQGVSLLSYAMTTAKELGEANQSRPRLVDRLTKEMIPAAFKALGLPRPADPSDPYSYSSGIKRTDQKRLKLSPPTREALDKLR